MPNQSNSLILLNDDATALSILTNHVQAQNKTLFLVLGRSAGHDSLAQMVANQSGVWNYAAQASNPSLLEAYLNSLPYDGNVQKPAFATWVSVCISKHQVIKRINTSADIGDSHICFLIG